MNEIRLTVHGKTRFYKGPANWEEVKSRKQFIALARLVFLGQIIPAARFAGLKAVYGMRPLHLKELFGSEDYSRKFDDAILTTADHNAIMGQKLLETTDWVFQTFPHSKFWFNSVRIFHHSYTGPGDGLGDMTFGQFIFVERYFADLHRGADNYVENLNMFLGSLFLKKGQKFMMDDVRRNAKMLRWLGVRTKEAILHNYSGLRHTLVMSFPEIFESSPEEGKKKKKKQDAGWLDVALSLAGDDLIKLHAYEDNNLWLVMKVIHNAVLRAKEMEKIANKSKK